MKPHFFKIGTGPVIDEETGTIKAVSLMELGNAEGHFDAKGRQMLVDETTLRQVYDFCVKNGNLKVKADHGSGVMATIGWADNFALTSNKVLADFHIYETEPQRPRIIEMAKKNPDHLGMSLEFGGKDEVKGEHCLARCESVYATALVSDPAANKSLFSAIPPENTETKTMENDDTKLEELSKKFDTFQTTVSDFITKFAKKFDDDETDKDLDDKSDKDMDDDPDKDKDKDLDADPDKKDDEDKKDYSRKEVEKIADDAAAKILKQFTSKMGITKLGAAGPVLEDKKGEKHFEEFVADLAVKDFSGDQNKARATILSNTGKHPDAWKAYQASRLVKHS